MSKEKVVLICEGLDTVSRIFINGVLIGKSKNMFVRYIFDIKSALQVIICLDNNFCIRCFKPSQLVNYRLETI